MFKTRIFDLHCCIIIVLLTWFTSMKVKAFPHQHLADVYDAKNILNDYGDANDMKTSGLNWSQEYRDMLSIIHLYNNNITFCRNQQVIHVPVNRHSDITTIPCFTQYESFRNGTDILLYKGSPETLLTPISGNNMQQHKILEYITDSGFLYNFSGEWPKNVSEDLERWRYTCFFANSDAKNYVTVELYRDDNSVFVNSRDCDPVYHVNDTGRFFCKIPGNANTTDFEWAYRTEDGKDLDFHPKGRGKQKYSYNGIVVEDIRVKLPYSNVIGIVCRVNQSDSNIKFQGLQHISVKDTEVPVVLDNGIVELDDEPGLQLNCSFIADSQSTHVFWLQDDSKMNNTSEQINWSIPVRSTTLNGLKSIYPLTSTNYTCVVENYLGFSSKTFIVTRNNPNPIYIYALVSLVPVFLLASVIACFEWKRRKNTVMTDYKNILKALKEKDPANSSSINFVKDLNNWAFLGRGVYGEVWKTEIAHINGEKQPVVLKTFTWPPFLSIKDVKLRFDDLINEIRICQELTMSGSSNIVRYEGFYAPEVHSFNVYLILDYCNPGQLEAFLYQHNQDDTFMDDIDTFGKTRVQSPQGNGTLKTSHLMKWAQQIAEAMTILHDKNIVHRDLASRNILLKKLDIRNNSIDDVYAQLADFGMSRFLRACSNCYIIQEDMLKERNIPVLWYPPESIGFDSKVEFTKQSDVWSFGVLLWEFFSRGSDPNLSYGFKGGIKAENVQQELRNGRRLGKEYLYNTPEEIWLLMEHCWSLSPEDRPDFSVISQKLKDINTSFGLYYQEVARTAEDLNKEVSNSTIDDNLKVANATMLLGVANNSEVTNQCAADAIELNNLEVTDTNSTKSTTDLGVTIATSYVSHGAFNADVEKVKGQHTNADTGQQEQSIPDQLMQNSDNVHLNMGENNATFRNTYMQHSLQAEE